MSCCSLINFVPFKLFISPHYTNFISYIATSKHCCNMPSYWTCSDGPWKTAATWGKGSAHWQTPPYQEDQARWRPWGHCWWIYVGSRRSVLPLNYLLLKISVFWLLIYLSFVEFLCLSMRWCLMPGPSANWGGAAASRRAGCTVEQQLSTPWLRLSWSFWMLWDPGQVRMKIETFGTPELLQRLS